MNLKIWVLKDSRIGSSKQSYFLAKELSEDIIEKNIVYNNLAFLPNILKPKKLGIDFTKSDILLGDNDYPNVIIFAGRRLAGLALYLKNYIFKKTNVKIKLISILKPDYPLRYFDFVILPYHDKIKKETDNIIRINGSLSTKFIDTKNYNYWDYELKNLNKPFYSFFIGGDIKNKKMNKENLLKTLNKISNFVKDKNGTLLISTSRRTNKDCIDILNNKNINCKNYIYKWKINDYNNPYNYFIDKSKIIFTTADSISMISEIITLNKPLYVYLENNILSKKHIEFCSKLINNKTIKNLENSKIEEFKFDEINELENVVKKIKERIYVN